MGSEASSNTDPNVQIYVQLDKPLYIAGQELHGNAYLNVLNDVYYDALYLQLEGVQKVSWKDSSVGRSIRGTLNTNKKQSYFDEFQIFNFNGNLPAGQYNFPFSLILPNGLSGTLVINQQSIKYYVTAYLKNYQQNNNSNIQMYMAPLNVIQPLRGQFGSLSLKGTTQVPGCCWQINKTKIQVNCNTNFAMTGDKIKIDAKIDNTEGSALEDCKFVICAHTFKYSSRNKSSRKLLLPFDLYIPQNQRIQGGTQKTYSFQAMIPENIYNSSAFGQIFALYYTINFVWKGLVLNSYTLQMHILIHSRNQKLILNNNVEVPPNWNPKVFHTKIINNLKPYIYQAPSSMPYRNQNGFQKMQENLIGQPPQNANQLEITEQDIRLEQNRINY